MGGQLYVYNPPTSKPGIFNAGHSSVALMMQFILKAFTLSSVKPITPQM